jgi:hypothetical protein
VVSTLVGFAAAYPADAQQNAQSPALNFSGVVYANYQYRTDPANKDFNKFDLERTYLTFRMAAGDRASVRVTTDVFQQQNAANAGYYGGWVIRMKYAYLQYDYAKAANWSANARIGLLHTVIIDHEEQFFPRWISQVATERAGYFSSADAGVATTVALPNHLGEIYATITNGPGYGNRETDRFKDYSARLSITPFADNAGLLKTFVISPWITKGAVVSRIAGVTAGLTRDRYGVFAGLRDPRLTAGAEVAGTSETGESGTAVTRVTADSSGQLVSGFIWAKPMAADSTSLMRKLGFLARYDQITPRTDVPVSPLWPAKYHIFIGGLTWDLTNRATLSFDYQESLPVSGGLAPISKTFFAHFVASF